MRLADFLSGPSSRIASTRRVTFKAIGHDDKHNRIVVDVSAALSFVDEKQRQEALRDAARAMAKEYGSDPVDPRRRGDEDSYHLLYRALRDADDPRVPFAGSVEELKQALVLTEANEVYSEYDRFCAEEFPPSIDDEEFRELIEEAKKTSLSDLLCSSRYLQIRKAWPRLVAHFGKSQTQT